MNELSELLSDAQAQMRITRARVSRSTLYDSRYHMAMIACAMRLHANGSNHRILAPWLKFLQFVAARPTLVDPFLEYSSGRREEGELQSWSQMPRGYIGDETHDSVIDLLVACGVLLKASDWIEASTRYSVLADLGARIEAEGLFAGERAIMDRLRSVRVTKVLLGAT
ncbi:MAG TPA: hypothetical protein VG963_12295 [Polyangiaceae bacterium]|nr:hypothetical protein [Polyangiaceae bacterium]